MPSKQITNDTLYARMDAIRIELKGDIASQGGEVRAEVADLRRRFEMLEEGRVSGVEKAIEELRANQTIANYRVMLVWGLIVFIVTVTVNFLIRKLAP